MRTLLALVCMLALLVSSRAISAAAAAKTPAAEAKSDAAKKEGPAKIEGVEVPRAKGGYLGVQIVDATFKITFYDAKKKAIAADVSRALLRWDPKYKVGQERVVLNRSGDGKSLASPRNIRPPYLFKLTIVLLKDAAEGDDATVAGETYVIDFKA